MHITPVAGVTTSIDVLDAPQVILDEGVTISAEIKQCIWKDSLAFPSYFAVASLAVLVIHLVVASGLFQKLYRQVRPTKVAEDEDEAEVEELDAQSVLPLVQEFEEHVLSHGGLTVYVLKVVRLVASLGLLGLSIATLILEEKQDASKDSVDVFGKHWGKKPKNKRTPVEGLFTPQEWLQFALCMTFAYISILGFVSVSAKPWWASVANFHMVVILLFTTGVYTYRDLYPLATFTLSPIDLHEGWLLWVKIGLVLLSGIVIPLVIPRPYVPFDPKACFDPQPTNPEQTASIVSLAVYSFLDPIVFKAYRLPHLSHIDLPPVPDYDFGRNLVKRSFKHLDTFSGAKGDYLFWGLMRVFRREYLTLTGLIIVRVVGNMLSPLSINRLLVFMQNGLGGAIVRPWVWILLLFLGPVISTVAFQYYAMINTGTLVRTQGIITQLVFEHALRVRMKAETEDGDGKSTNNTAVGTPETASVGQASPGGSEGSEDETARESSTPDSQTKGKGKDKDAKKSEITPAAAAAVQAKASNLVGKINNLVTTDLGNLVDGRDFLFVALYGPLQVILCMAFLYFLLGWSSFVGLVVMISLAPVPGYIAKLLQTVQAERMKKTDARVETVTETMNVLRMIKLFGWEGKMSERLSDKREDELTWLWKRQILGLLNGNINYIIPVAHMIATFVTYTLVMKKELSAAIVFSAMALFDILRDQLYAVFFMIPMFIQAKVSLDRVDEFLKKTELLDSFSDSAPVLAALSIAPNGDDDAIGFKDATFSWSAEEVSGSLTPAKRSFRLRIEDELLFKKGCINLVIGPTGSGKTSLLMALLGEMHFIPSGPGSWFGLPRGRGIAYAAQESWVQNETIKENILFGAPYDDERYKKGTMIFTLLIYQCALTRDLTLFDAGDQTEVGEKGLTLSYSRGCHSSGGQKARITLARAVYSQAEILLLDDVLAALDVHTSKWIVDKCLKGDLIRGRTVILVTHNVALASPVANFVVSIGTDGRILSQGTVSDALAKDHKLSKEVAQEEKAMEKVEDEIDSAEQDAGKPDNDAKKDAGKLVVAEEVAVGHVSWSAGLIIAVKLYLLGMSGNWPALFWSSVMGCLIACELSNTVQTWFLGYWAQQYQGHTADEVYVP
ncbi:hypothetical protein NEOLEDRAFT_1152799 [Neolentinus lepideus HHB14362 ss-1]|uniref:P-loop containing nucleoside triphosphate hydrolase protein n=1 Tax=Neolentinus lepideus HHB14362 ss-1 TaxID=1314782 RepID=A0A165MAJ2_9AGAM|nr:hypothetical protein NEOLEDRAFT_1152799 [Neolentinus lepideus HHB14362 ss-1]